MRMHFLVIAFCSFILCSCSKEENNDSFDDQTPIVSSNWEMLWSDEFDGEELIDEAEDTLTILSKYVNSLNIDNKKELDTLLTTLYNESLTVETV